MKWLSILLAFNLLVATNGIALCDHFCSVVETSETKPCCDGLGDQNCAPEENEEDCCYVNYTDFLKQDIEAYNSSSLEMDEIISSITLNVLFPTNIGFDLSEVGIDNVNINSPPVIVSKASNDRSLFQVFLC